MKKKEITMEEYEEALRNSLEITIDMEREKYNQEKEQRFKEFIEYNQKLFKELKENSDKSDKTKEKRIKELMTNNE